ncbi:MAG: metallophosphoesterase, partial [Phycisphaerae bacterium]|nr:metallophosphoesterase [Phycisphaerae bacterium]
MRTVRIWTLVLGALAAVFLGGCSEKTEEANFTFVVIGDTRPGGGDRITQPAVHLKSIEEINLLAPELVVNVGDFILGYNSGEGFDLTFKQWDEFDRVVKELKMPLYLAPGNHDIWDERSQEVYEKRYGAPYYSFDKGGCHFVILCSDLAKPKEAGSITGDQLVWLRNDLEQNAVPGRTFVFLHQPLWQQVHVSGAAKAGWMKDVHPLLVQHRVHTVFAGHVHAYEYDSIDGVGYIITGGGGAALARPEITGGFHHYMTVTVTPKETSLAVIPVGSIKPQEVVSAEFRRKFEGMSASADIKTLVVGKDSLDDIPVTFELKNVLDQPLKV